MITVNPDSRSPPSQPRTSTRRDETGSGARRARGGFAGAEGTDDFGLLLDDGPAAFRFAAAFGAVLAAAGAFDAVFAFDCVDVLPAVFGFVAPVAGAFALAGARPLPVVVALDAARPPEDDERGAGRFMRLPSRFDAFCC
jgi:hypothetical protein